MPECIPTKYDIYNYTRSFLVSEEGIKAFPEGKPGEPMLLWSDPESPEDEPVPEGWIMPVKRDGSYAGYLQWRSDQTIPSSVRIFRDLTDVLMTPDKNAAKMIIANRARETNCRRFEDPLLTEKNGSFAWRSRMGGVLSTPMSVEMCRLAAASALQGAERTFPAMRGGHLGVSTTYFDLNGVPSARVFPVSVNGESVGFITVSASAAHGPKLHSSGGPVPSSLIPQALHAATQARVGISPATAELTLLYIGGGDYYALLFDKNTGVSFAYGLRSGMSVDLAQLKKQHCSYFSKERDGKRSAEAWGSILTERRDDDCAMRVERIIVQIPD